MNSSAIIIFIVVLTVGIFALRWANRVGQNQKEKYENEASNRISRSLAKLGGDPSEYSFYTCNIKTGIWHKTSMQEMKNAIIKSCTISSPDSYDYSPARYSFKSVPSEKKVYYVVGIEKYDFKNIPAKNT